MQHVRTAGTDIERVVALELHARGYRYRKNVRSLPGSPDLVFARDKVAVFIDGDFWHGYRFATWRHQIPAFWQVKIDKNRRRDERNFRLLRRQGWTVIRIWQHDVEKNLAEVVRRIASSLS